MLVDKESKKNNTCDFDSRESRQDRPQFLKNDKYLTFKNSGLIAAQYKGILDRAYSLRHTLYVLYNTVFTVFNCLQYVRHGKGRSSDVACDVTLGLNYTSY